jgi:hypothetical protein
MLDGIWKPHLIIFLSLTAKIYTTNLMLSALHGLPLLHNSMLHILLVHHHHYSSLLLTNCQGCRLGSYSLAHVGKHRLGWKAITNHTAVDPRRPARSGHCTQRATLANRLRCHVGVQGQEARILFKPHLMESQHKDNVFTTAANHVLSSLWKSHLLAVQINLIRAVHAKPNG